MAPTIRSDASQFSSCSIEQMQPTIEAASCITTLLGVDVSISDARTSQTLLLGDDANLDIAVGNLGSEQSTNVQLDITMPEIVTYVSSSATSGTCSEGAGQVACQLGTLPGGGTNTVRIVTRTLAPGTGSFRVSLSADVDENPDNNQALAGITVDPAVDLVVTSASRAQVTLDKASKVSVSLENLAALAATNAVLTVTLDAGLRADSASWSIGSCAIDGQQISCQAGNFPALSSATLTAEVTGIAAGQHEYHATITSAEADRDDTNNNASGVVAVNVPGGSGTEPQGDNGGGGSIGMAMLSLLFIVWLRMRVGHSAASIPRRG
jgi:uncharacterized repeat protein (TIGR01451 family)